MTTPEQFVRTLLRPRYSKSVLKAKVLEEFKELTDFEVESLIDKITIEMSGISNLEMEKLQRELDFYRNQYEIFKSKKNLIDELISACKINLPILELPTKKIETTDIGEHLPEVAVLVLGDLHFGFNVTDLEAPNSYMIYNQEVAENRLSKILKEFIDIIDEKRKTRDINDVVVCFLGDIVEGSWQNINCNKDDVVRQVLSGTKCIAGLLQQLSSHFNTLKVYCVYGNHGVLQKGQPDYVNWDYIAYRFLAEMLPDLEFNISTLNYNVFSIFNYKYCIIHGGNIKMFYRTPYYGIETADTNLKAVLNKMGIDYDMLILGHFHQPAFLPTQSGMVLMNGSLTGYSPFGFKLHRFYPPSQICFGVHPKHKISWFYSLEL